VIDEYSRLALAIRVGRRCKAAEVIDTIEELLKLYPPPTHLRMDNGPEFVTNALQEGAPAAVATRLTSHQVHPGRIHSWSHSTAGSGMSS
jgi:transposase InsO family protein